MSFSLLSIRFQAFQGLIEIEFSNQSVQFVDLSAQVSPQLRRSLLQDFTSPRIERVQHLLDLHQSGPHIGREVGRQSGGRHFRGGC